MTFKQTLPSELTPSTDTSSGNGWSRSPSYIAIAFALTLTACSDDDDSPGMSTDGDTSIPAGRFAVAMNDGQNTGSVFIYSPDLATLDRTLETGANQGLAIGSDGTLFQNGDGAGDAGIRAMNRATDRADMDGFGASDRIIGSAPGKGLFTLPTMGLLASCDVTDEQAGLKFYSATAGEQAQAVSSISLPASCWDGFHAENEDRLYLALTNGSLAIIDDVSQIDLLASTGVQSLGDEVLDRIVTVVDSDGTQQSMNFHGVSVENGKVLVSDVGSADSSTDGALYVFSDNGSLNGEVMLAPVSGTATMLGNPVDVLLIDGDAIVAEKSNNAILVFNGISGRSGDVMPDYQIDFTNPESLVALGMDTAIQDASDIASGDTVSRLLIGQNPAPQQDTGMGADNSNVGRISLIDAPADAGIMDTGLDVSAASVTGNPGQQSFRTLENIQLDSAGNGYAVYDVTDGTSIFDSGILAINGLSARDDMDIDVMSLDRIIGGASAGLTSPKGIEIVGNQGALIIADVGNDSTAPGLVVLSANAGNNAMPLFTVVNTGNAAIWDTDYDAVNDRLYAAGTGGDVLVYDDFFATGASAIPTRSFRPADSEMTSNLHGIAYDEASDKVLATDVGDAASATDGSFYLISNASTASGAVTPVATVSGASSMLGNPVDIAFDGSSVYIAEKSNDRVLVYRNVMDLAGSLDMAADEFIAISKPESVTLRRQ